MTYVNAIKYIKAHSEGVPSPERMRMLCRYLSDPQRQLKFVHFAGGSGKTSCAEMLSVILGESGYNIGMLLTSFVKEEREMISIGNKYISHNEFAKCVESVAAASAKMKADIKIAAEETDDAISESQSDIMPQQRPKITKNLLEGKISPEPTASEIICAAAFLAFRENDCNICLLECGESRADPTGIIDPPLVAVVCGGTLSEEQLRTGSGIIRRGTREVVTSVTLGESYSAILDACVRVGCRLTVPARAELHHINFGLSGRSFDYRGKNYVIPHCAEYQLTNALIVIETVYALRRTGVALHSEDVARGIGEARIPLRFELFSVSPAIIFDCPRSSSDVAVSLEALSKISHIIGKNIIIIEDQESLISNDNISERGFICHEVILPITETDDKAVAEKAAKLASDETMLVIGSPTFCGRIKNRIAKMLAYR